MNARVKWVEDHPNLIQDIELGMVKQSILSMYVHYLIYCEYRRNGKGKVEAVQMLAEDRHVSFSAAWRSVNFYEETIKQH